MNRPRHQHARNYHARRGVSLFEAVTSVAMLGMVLALGAKALIEVDRHGGRVDQRRRASLILANEMERQIAQPWEQLSPAEPTPLDLPEAAQSLCRSGLTRTVIEEPDPAAARRITLRLSWQGTPGAHREEMTLTAWSSRSQPKEAAP